MQSTMRFLRQLLRQRGRFSFFFFFNDTATTEIYTLSLHDALPISAAQAVLTKIRTWLLSGRLDPEVVEAALARVRSEEHTSELQSQSNLVCRLLLEKKKHQTAGHRYRVTTPHAAAIYNTRSPR